MKDEVIRDLETKTLCLEETVQALKESRDQSSALQKEGRQYPIDMRMFVYDGIVNHVPTKNVPILIEKYTKRSGIIVDSVPHRNTVEMMARELGVVSDFQAAEILCEKKDLTLGFDATTQEGLHVNSVHITSQDDCLVLAIDQLAGGTAEDYEHHISDSIDRVADVYSRFHDTDFDTCRSMIINNISNTMTDRAIVNHVTIERLEETWGTSLNELNCHLHPLDTIASSARAALKANEPEN